MIYFLSAVQTLDSVFKKYLVPLIKFSSDSQHIP